MDASCNFSTAKWEEKPYQQISSTLKLTKASVAFDLKGQIDGQATVEYVMLYTQQNPVDPHASKAIYVGLMRIEGKVDGKKGSFVLEDRGIYEEGSAKSTLSVILGSGTGELKGISGKGNYSANQENNSFNLQYYF